MKVTDRRRWAHGVKVTDRRGKGRWVHGVKVTDNSADKGERG